jgi:hypothetical protein
MEINVDKTKVMRISRKPSPLYTMIDQKQVENVEYLNCLSSMTTNDARCTCEIKYRIAMAKAVMMMMMMMEEEEEKRKKKMEKRRRRR